MRVVWGVSVCVGCVCGGEGVCVWVGGKSVCVDVGSTST